MTLLVVWSPATVLVALVAGLGFGHWVIGRLAADPAWASPTATAGRLGFVTGLLTILGGVVFFVGQATAALFEGDANWPRVVSRSGLWVLYGVAMGIGTWYRVNRHIARKRAETLSRAKSELGK